MIVRETDGGWRFITQPDHARFAGELLRYWRRSDLASHPRRGEIVFAAREHDNGWREADAAPSWDGERGRPHDFLSLPDAVRIEVWLRGTARFAASRPYAALLVCLHALNFYRRRGDEAWDRFVATLEERRGELLAASGADLATALADYRFVRFADAASLAACSGRSEPFAERLPGDGGEADEAEVRGRFDPETGELRLAPFPLAGATRFEVPSRTVERRPYTGDADLGGALAAARWGRHTVRVTGGDGG